MSLFQKIGGLFKSVADFVSTELSKLGADLKTAESDLENVATIAVKALNAARTFVTTNPVGETLLSVIEAVPGAGPIASEIVNTILPKAISVVTTIEADASNPEALAVAGLTAIGAKTDADELTTAYTSIASIITNDIAPLLKVVSTLQAAISVVPTVYAAVKKAA